MGPHYFIASNLFNSGALLNQLSQELLVLCERLGSDNVYVSIFENGSTDDTGLRLRALDALLTLRGVRHSIVSSSVSWRSFCPETLSGGALTRCLTDPCNGNDELRGCTESIRIPVMAALRNRALANLPGELERAGGRDTIVLFINDVLLYADDMMALIDTNSGDYDMACGMDFEGLTLYDTWVARDLNGATLSEWYPFMREATSQARLRSDSPFRVYACWNGAVAIRVRHGHALPLNFRTWKPSENRSPLVDSVVDFEQMMPRDPSAPPALAQRSPPSGWVWDDSYCAVSECQLLCKDFWSAGATQIYMNPRVRLFYNAKTRLLQSLLMPLVNAVYMSWANRISTPHHALRGQRIRAVVGSSTPWDSPGYADLPPISVACGNSGHDLLTPRELMGAKRGEF